MPSPYRACRLIAATKFRTPVAKTLCEKFPQKHILESRDACTRPNEPQFSSAKRTTDEYPRSRAQALGAVDATSPNYLPPAGGNAESNLC